MPSSPAPPGLRKFIGAVHDEWRMFSDDPDDYEIGLPIGFGATSIVYSAKYIAKDGSPPYPCAVKVVDLDKLLQQSLRLLRRETQLMSLSKHPNLLRVRGSWITGHNLYIALRLMNAGSAADVMHYGWPGGMEEEVVKSILKQALEGLNYLHINGFIHRDVKAANLLIDDDGTVLLGDLGVATSLSDEEPLPPTSGLGQRMNFNRSSNRDDYQTSAQGPSKVRLGKRKSFVGTPCWMAPELISGKQYDAKADIWSFGITAIELTQGRAPHSRESPSRVLLKTVQDAPPAFARESGQYKFSKAFKEIVESCLMKDPVRRPTAAELLETSFFKSAKRKHYLVNTILKGLPPLIHRQERRLKASPLTAQDRTSISSWDFSVELPQLPEGRARSQHGSSHPTYINPGFSHHSHHPSHSHNNTIALPSPTRLEALEESKYADHFKHAKATRPEFVLTDVDAGADADAEAENAGDTHSSVGSSVFDLEEAESNPTTPELLAVSVAGSSVATTPLSCSPATAPVMLVQQGKNYNSRSEQESDEAACLSSSPPPPSLGVPDKTNLHSHRDSTSRENTKAQHIPPRRRGSSPTSTTADRSKVSPLPALKRVASTSGCSGSKTLPSAGEASYSAAGDSTKLAGALVSPQSTATPKESRWRKFIRGSGFSASPVGQVEDSPRRSTLGRIWERSGR